MYKNVYVRVSRGDLFTSSIALAIVSHRPHSFGPPLHLWMHPVLHAQAYDVTEVQESDMAKWAEISHLLRLECLAWMSE